MNSRLKIHRIFLLQGILFGKKGNANDFTQPRAFSVKAALATALLGMVSGFFLSIFVPGSYKGAILLITGILLVLSLNLQFLSKKRTGPERHYPIVPVYIILLIMTIVILPGV